MSIKTIEELKVEIALLPNQYKAALEKQTQKFLEVSSLKAEIAKLKDLLSSESEGNNLEENEIIDDDSDLLDLETNLEKLKLKLSHTEFNVELDARRTTEKLTESTVKAIVGIDEDVHILRNQLIEDQAKLKARKSELNRQKQDRREKERLNRWQTKTIPENKELGELENQLLTVKGEHLAATDEVDFLKIKLESYSLLVGLENLENLEQ